ncbi:MAG: acylphosphatase [candidate division KSB1 bacterium]|nr:acylphosphatase [candidate division KSB1 bacterium]
MDARARIIVHGMVQGVGFRYFAYRQATVRGLKGYVRNRPDGTVESVVEGERGMIEDYARELNIGPRYARVTRVDVHWEPFAGEFKSFEVRF